jgi:hypothetical protein
MWIGLLGNLSWDHTGAELANAASAVSAAAAK